MPQTAAFIATAGNFVRITLRRTSTAGATRVRRLARNGVSVGALRAITCSTSRCYLAKNEWVLIWQIWARLLQARRKAPRHRLPPRRSRLRLRRILLLPSRERGERRLRQPHLPWPRILHRRPIRMGPRRLILKRGIIDISIRREA